MPRLIEIPLDQIKPNPQQPRKKFDKQELHELADSIREHGVLQPIEVEQDPKGGFILHHGERRWRASKIAGRRTIPAVVTDPMPESVRLERAVVENNHREPMNPIEEALAFDAMRQNGQTVGVVAKKAGRSVGYVAIRLGWLRYDHEIQQLVADGFLPMDKRVQETLDRLPEEMRVRFARRMMGQGVRTIEMAADGYLRAIHNTADGVRPKGGGKNGTGKKLGREKAPAERRSHALTAVLGDEPLPGNNTVLVQSSLLATCKACSLFQWPAGAGCDKCPATTFVRSYVRLVERI